MALCCHDSGTIFQICIQALLVLSLCFPSTSAIVLL
jgi:hypothetical protein